MEDKETHPPKGLICPLVTPLKKDRRLDERSLHKLVEHVRPAVEGLLVGDVLWGEGLLLPTDTRLELVRTTLDVIAGRCPVMVTVTARTFEETAAFMARVSSLLAERAYGGEFFWVDYPLFYRGNRDLPEHYHRLTRETRRAWILGNLPSMVKRYKGCGRHCNIRTGVLRKTAQQRSIKGLIFSGTLKRSLNYQKTLRFRGDLTFYDGDEFVFLNNPGTGGLVAGGSNLFPRQWRDIIDSSLNRCDVQRQFLSHQATIWERGRMVQDLYRLYQSAPAASLKRILAAVGLISSEHTLDPPDPAGAVWTGRLKRFLDAYDLN